MGLSVEETGVYRVVSVEGVLDGYRVWYVKKREYLYWGECGGEKVDDELFYVEGVGGGYET